METLVIQSKQVWGRLLEIELIEARADLFCIQLITIDDAITNE